MGDVTIGTHYFDLRQISNEQDGDRGERDVEEELLLLDRKVFFSYDYDHYYRVFTNLWAGLDQPLRFCPELFTGRRDGGAKSRHRGGRVLQVGVQLFLLELFR